MRFARSAGLAILTAAAAAGQFAPQITLNPETAAAGSGDLTVTISGTHFTPNLQMLWNGSPRATTFQDADTLKATIPAADLAQPGLFSITLSASDSGAAASDSTPFMVFVPLRANDLIYDPQRSLIYVAVSAQDVNGPSIAFLDPIQGVVRRYLPMPEEPGVLALSGDLHYLFVGMNGLVRRLDLNTRSDFLDLNLAGLGQWTPGAPPSTILPITNDGVTVAVSLNASDGTATYVFDGAQARPGYTGTGSSCFLGSPDGTTFYGFDHDALSLIIYKLTPAGLALAPEEIRDVFLGFGCPVDSNGLVYDTAGDIFDLSSQAMVGKFAAWGIVLPVPQANRIYAVGSTPYASGLAPIYLMTFDLATGKQIGNLRVPVTMNSFQGRLISWGSGGLAFADAPNDAGASNRVFVLQAPAN